MRPYRILMLMCGLPRSGKTTAAQRMVFPIVSPDAIRLALHGQRFAPEAEGFVWSIARVMARSLFLAGHQTVVIDATHVTRARRDEWRDALRGMVDEVQVCFIDTPAEECIRRARAAGDEEIVPVIERMAAALERPDDDEIRVLLP